MLASIEAPNTREPWFELAALMYRQHRWSECYAFALKCISIADRELVYTVDPEVWGPQIHDYAAISAYWLGMTKKAIHHGEFAVMFAPDDLRLKNNLLLYQAGGVTNNNTEAA